MDINIVKALKRILVIDGFSSFSKENRIAHLAKIIHTLADFTSDDGVLVAFEDIYHYDKLINNIYGVRARGDNEEIKKIIQSDIKDLLMVDGVLGNLIRTDNFQSIKLRKNGVFAKAFNDLTSDQFKKVFTKPLKENFDYTSSELSIFNFLNNYVANPIPKFYSLGIPNLTSDIEFFKKICKEEIEYDSYAAEFFFNGLKKRPKSEILSVLTYPIIGMVESLVMDKNIGELSRLADVSDIIDFKDYVKEVLHNPSLFPILLSYDIVCKRESPSISPVICVRQELVKNILYEQRLSLNGVDQNNAFLLTNLYPLFAGHSYMVGKHNLNKKDEICNNLKLTINAFEDLKNDERITIFKKYMDFILKSSKNKDFNNGFSLLYIGIGMLKISKDMIDDEIILGFNKLKSTISHNDSLVFLSLYGGSKNDNVDIQNIKEVMIEYVNSMDSGIKKDFFGVIVENIIHINRYELSSLGTIVTNNQLSFEDLLCKQNEMLSFFNLSYDNLKISFASKSRNNIDKNLFEKFKSLLEVNALKEATNPTNNTLKQKRLKV